jgi:hypothetical protein
MRQYFDVVFYTTSIPAAGALVFVTDSTTGAMASLYSDDGVTPTTNPVTCDETGFYAFYTADGIYDLQYMVGPVTLRTIDNVQIYDISAFVNSPISTASMIAWFAALPTTLPATAGQPWNNGGTLSFS